MAKYSYFKNRLIGKRFTKLFMKDVNITNRIIWAMAYANFKKKLSDLFSLFTSEVIFIDPMKAV